MSDDDDNNDGDGDGDDVVDDADIGEKEDERCK